MRSLSCSYIFPAKTIKMEVQDVPLDVHLVVQPILDMVVALDMVDAQVVVADLAVEINS